jgi:hypothetical protein
LNEIAGHDNSNRFLTPNIQPATTNNQQPTTNNQQPTTNNQQPTTNNQHPTTPNQQPTTNNQQPTTNNQQPTPNNQHPTTNTQQSTMGGITQYLVEMNITLNSKDMSTWDSDQVATCGDNQNVNGQALAAITPGTIQFHDSAETTTPVFHANTYTTPKHTTTHKHTTTPNTPHHNPL